MNKKRWILSAMLAGLVGLSMQAHADIIKYLNVPSDGTVRILVDPSGMPACTAMNYYLVIPTNEPNKSMWLSLLIAAKMAQSPVVISYSVADGCAVTQVSLR